MKANWKLKNLLSIINIKIISEVCALQVCVGMSIKSEYKGVCFSKCCVWVSLIEFWRTGKAVCVDSYTIMLLGNSVQNFGIRKYLLFHSGIFLSFLSHYSQ